MDDFRADMHCHSTCSDGTCTPEELVDLAAKNGLKGLSITDHDSIKAYQSALEPAAKQGIQLLSGVEFSAQQDSVNVHILAYAFAFHDSLIAEFCQKHTVRRLERNREILDLLRMHRMPMKEQDVWDLSPQGTIGRPHIALAMINYGYVKSLQEAFKKYLGDGKPCFASGKPFSVEETLDVIHKAKGLAIIAHPHLIDHAPTHKRLLELDFDGIECYYGKFPAHMHEKWLEIAHNKDWLISGGSDFHGSMKPGLNLGNSWVNEEIFNQFYSHLQANLRECL
ncbi:PHP domain-containing protein [Parachlamydia sp. AcF125]|uniref:PHP domain-containing protein n=1 Tax=Parachlamydia sp. AcF125 TaxID=2795736 RepID=UPI001BC98D75|nr:PHP domain-containing protein [Parachlamydia sp. AcF125]MBS4169210.1 5'-3' exoribonuclease [Parachlamydia sp. AcF125]